MTDQPYKAELGQRLRARLFECDRSGPVALYNLRDPGEEQLARELVCVHGVCLQCHRWAVDADGCPACGAEYMWGDIPYATGSHAWHEVVERRVGEACTKAWDLVKRA